MPVNSIELQEIGRLISESRHNQQFQLICQEKLNLWGGGTFWALEPSGIYVGRLWFTAISWNSMEWCDFVADILQKWDLAKAVISCIFWNYMEFINILNMPMVPTPPSFYIPKKWFCYRHYSKFPVGGRSFLRSLSNLHGDCIAFAWGD